MDQQASSAAGARNRTSVERRGDRELVVTRIFDAPPGMVYKAWSRPELFRRWWVPRSASGVSLLSWFLVLYWGRMLPFIGNAF